MAAGARKLTVVALIAFLLVIARGYRAERRLRGRSHREEGGTTKQLATVHGVSLKRMQRARGR